MNENDESIEGSAAVESAPRRGRRRSPDGVEQVGVALGGRRRRKVAAPDPVADVPIDGDHNHFLKVRVTDPRFGERYETYWVSPFGLKQFRYRGWVEVTWGEGVQPEAAYEMGNPGEPIVYNELRLMKLPREKAELIRKQDRARLRHRNLMRQVMRQADNFTHERTNYTVGARPSDEEN